MVRVAEHLVAKAAAAGVSVRELAASFELSEAEVLALWLGEISCTEPERLKDVPQLVKEAAQWMKMDETWLTETIKLIIELCGR